MAAAGAEQAAVGFDHMAVDIRDLSEAFSAVKTAVEGGYMKVKFGFAVKV